MPKININKLMDEIVSINNQKKGLDLLLQSKKSILAKFFQSSGKRSISNDDVTCYQREQTNIEYDTDAIQANLPKSLYSQFLVKNYTIPDWNRFVQFCKKHNISGNELKGLISVKTEVDQSKLNLLYDKGKVTLEDLECCYEATVKKSIALKFKNIESEIPIKGPQ